MCVVCSGTRLWVARKVRVVYPKRDLFVGTFGNPVGKRLFFFFRRLGADRCARRGLAGEVGDARPRAADRNTTQCPRDAPSTGGACPRPPGHARPPLPGRVRPRGGRLLGRKYGQNRQIIFYVEERFRGRRCPHRSAQLSASISAQDPVPGKPGSVRRFFAAPSIRPPTTLFLRARHTWGCLSRKI